MKSLFYEKRREVFLELGEDRPMVLSTALDNHVTSRMMSVLVMDETLYFQTDYRFRKYRQCKENPKVSLCVENIQMEGICLEIGHPRDHRMFCRAYQKCFPTAYEKYSFLEAERLFQVKLNFIQRWIYEGDRALIESLDMIKEEVDRTEYRYK